MAAYQNYANTGYNAYMPYTQRPFYGGYQQPMQPLQPIQQPIPQQPIGQQNIQVAPQPSIAPINDVRFVTADEAKGFMVLPYQNALLIDTTNKMAWLKMADGLGQSTTKFFKYSETEQPQAPNSQGEHAQVDLSNFAKKEDLTVFATKQDMQAIVQALDNLQRRLQINEIEKTGANNGTVEKKQ